MGKQVEIVKSFAYELLQIVDHGERWKLHRELKNDKKYLPGIGHPFMHLDNSVIHIWEVWRSEVEKRRKSLNDENFMSGKHQVCIVVSDIYRDGKFIQEFTDDKFGVYIYCFNYDHVFIESKFIDGGVEFLN